MLKLVEYDDRKPNARNPHYNGRAIERMHLRRQISGTDSNSSILAEEGDALLPIYHLSGRGKRLRQIVDQIVNVFDADRKTDHILRYASFFQLVGRELPVRCRRRVASQ